MLLEHAGMSANDIDAYQAEPANVQEVIESAAAAVRESSSTPAKDALHDEVMQGFDEQRAEDMLGVTEQEFIEALAAETAQKLVVEQFPGELQTIPDHAP